MDSKFSPEKELPEPQYQEQQVRAVQFCPPNYARISASGHGPNMQIVPPQQEQTLIPYQPHVAVPAPALPTHEWRFCHHQIVPPNAVHAGYDINGEVMFVGRVFHNGDYIPAKVFPSSRAYIPYQGQEIRVTNFECLVGEGYIWVPGQPFPEGAVCVNPGSQNVPSYVGRTNFRNSLVCGKFVRSNNRLYIPFDSSENIVTDNYEILIKRNN